MATLGELQAQLAALKERYSAVIEGSYSAEESIATIAVNMQEQLDDAQAAATSAGTYAAIAENAADEAAIAGAQAGAEAGASEAQTKYDAIFTEEHSWDKTQTFYSLNVTKKADFSYLSGQKGEFYSLNATNAAAEKGNFYSLVVRHSLSMLDAELSSRKGNFYSIDANKVGATEVNATDVNASKVKLDVAGSTTKVQFDAAQAQNGIDVNIAGYAQYSDGTSAVVDTTLHTRSLDVYSQAKVGELSIAYSSRSVRATITDNDHNLLNLKLDTDDYSTYSALLTCYSAALDYCAVANTLSVGQLLIGDTSLSQSELAQLKALLNQ